ncbi:hypothetical protein P3102_18550 [Amycolatopsis sp. QT-25]|uniref:hypothetical protein n=1 Tax=Amycolatopsis sp. QT-25 TaxID=3034022 RepID=UPI0023ED340C|nr:hypothetical protein [Amycolatopsis sp. QT-25]WET83065.1 hypothetical protein P3102_18550 [Amycolatopsis sp. QT-25]
MWSKRVDSAILNGRYEAAPQLEIYDGLEPRVHPWVAMSAPRGVRTATVSTDYQGFRRTPTSSGVVDCATPAADGVVLGGSFVFGVGAESDQDTVTAHLAHLTGRSWRNLGIRAGTSTHELVAALPFLEGDGQVVVCSGANNLIAGLQTNRPHDVYGPLFFEETLLKVGTRSMHDVAALIEGEARPGRNGAVRSVPEPEGPGGLTFDQRRTLALERQLRDLRSLVRLAGDPGQIVFCAQPFVDKSARSHVPEEQPLLGLHDRQLGQSWERIREYALAAWPRYTEELGNRCGELGVRFVDMPANRFRGWTFVDRLHCRGEGYRQAAELIVAAL